MTSLLLSMWLACVSGGDAPGVDDSLPGDTLPDDTSVELEDKLSPLGGMPFVSPR